MYMIRTTNGSYQQAGYVDEFDLKAAIIEVQRDLFGANRIYQDVKKKIGTKVVMRNIPDG
jgi:hypothetical protein